MKQIVKILIDKYKLLNSELKTEHGFSAYFEVDGKHYLVDTGQSNNFLINAAYLNVPVEQVEHLIISHPHFDHIGGLNAFLDKNKIAQIHISNKAFQQNYYSYRHKQSKFIGFDCELNMQNIRRFNFMHKKYNIDDQVVLITNFVHTFALPKANGFLYVKKDNQIVADKFEYEIAVCIQCNNELTIISPCSHNGIRNILHTVQNTFTDKIIKTVIGGFHILDTDEQHHYESPEEITQLAHSLRTDFPNATFYTGHCTGQNTFDIMKSVLENRIERFVAGDEIILTTN